MAKYAKGDQVRNIISNLKGVIVTVHEAKRGRQAYDVMYSDGTVSGAIEATLCPEINLSDAFERCKNKIYDSQSEFCLANTTFKIFNSNNNTLSSLKASKTIFRAYQFKPLLKYLNSDNRRILVADEVGLGKTIEAGHILLEMKARGQLRNALIICPKSLQVKWREELLNKFGLPFKIYDDLTEYVQDLKDRGSNLKAILNYEKVRSNKEKLADGKTEIQKNPLLSYLQETDRFIDFVICDEAHRLRNESTQQARGARILFEKVRSVVMLTATPIMLDEHNLFSLLNLLQPDRFPNYNTFKSALDYNKPFIHALSALGAGIPSRQLIDTLRKETIQTGYTINDVFIAQDERTVDEIFGDTPLYQKILKDCCEKEDTPEYRAELQYDLSRMNPINTLFTRTRKVEVTTDWSQPRRDPHKCIVQLYPEEQQMFDEVIHDYIEDSTYINYYGEETFYPGASLGLVQRKRMVASSVYGMKNSTDLLDQGIDVYRGHPDAKVDELIRIIEAIKKHGNGKVIVFALFKNTLKYLNIRLNAAGYRCVMIHGDIQKREEVIEGFRDDPNISVLLSSEVGSEGLDMQFCNSIVNYDLPWNPMVVEQRIGRVDRFGQKSEVVNIYNIVVKGSIQEQIYIRLLDRIGIFKESVGDLEAILDKEIEIEGKKMNISELFQNTEREFYTIELTEEQRNKKAEQIDQAFENEKLNLKHVEEGLSNSLTNDAYFKTEIDRMVNTYAYVSEGEIRNAIEKLIERRLPTCTMTQVSDDEFEFNIPSCTPRLVSSFLEEHMPPESNEDGRHLFAEYKYMLRDCNRFRITFSQSFAFDHKKADYYNIYHPMVMATADYFRKELDKFSSTYCLRLSAEDAEYKPGEYYLAMYRIKLVKTIYGNETASEVLVPILYNIVTETIEDKSMLANKIQGQAQVNGKYLPSADVTTTPEEVDILRGELLAAIEEICFNMQEDERIRIETDKQMQDKRIRELYKTRIQRYEDSISQRERMLEYMWDEKDKNETRNLISRMEGSIRSLEMERDSEIAKVDTMRVNSVQHQLFSLTYIKVD